MELGSSSSLKHRKWFLMATERDKVTEANKRVGSERRISGALNDTQTAMIFRMILND